MKLRKRNFAAFRWLVFCRASSECSLPGVSYKLETKIELERTKSTGDNANKCLDAKETCYDVNHNSEFSGDSDVESGSTKTPRFQSKF